MLKTDEKSGSASSLSQKSPFITQMEDPIESLDQYGVWVKSGPEPIEEEVFEIEEENQLKDLPETSSMELTSEEEELLGSLETEERPEETLAQEEGEKTGLEDIELEEEALDLDFGELPELETPEAAGWEAKKTTPEETSAPTGLEDLEDFEIEEETFQTEEEQPAATLPTAEEEVESFKMEEPVIEVEEELPELELEEPAELIQKSETLEGIETIKEEPSEPMAAEAMGEGGQEVPKEVQKEPMASRESSSIQEETPVQFNDVEAVAREMGGEATTLQMDILTKIEEELAEIKNELAELKRELSSLRPSAPLPVAEETKEIPQSTQEEEGAGFFEEDEDETIALTGDELDNILNTADITEETGEPSAVPEDLELEPLMGETAPEAMIPVTTPEEQAIIEEYNKELERFTADEIPFEAEDRIDQEAVEALPEEVLEKEDLFEVEEKPKQETFVMEKPAPETVPTLTDLVSEEATGTARPSTEEVVFEETFTQAPVSEAPISEELPGTEEGVIEFDLESLEEVEETPEEVQEEGTPKVEEPKEAFEEELEEMELSLPEEGEKGIEVEEVPVVEEAGATEVPELEEVETLPEEVPIVPLEEPIPDLHIPVEPTSTTEAPSKQPKPVVEETTKKPTLTSGMPESLREEIKAVLKYMDQLLEALPEEKIQEFARSEHFDVYRRLFEELGLE